MNTSEQINEIATALAKAQGEMTNPTFNKTNPHFKSSYADLSSVLNAVRPALAKNGIALMQMTGMEEAGVVLYTRLTHISGQWIESVYPVTASGKHQEIAAALTYAKRLSLSAIAGVAGEDDDDGNEADKVPVNAARPAKQAPKPVANAYSDQESGEDIEDPIEFLDQRRARCDHDTTQHNHRQNAPQQGAILIRPRDGKEGEDQADHEDIVDRQRLFDEESGIILHPHFRAFLHPDPGAKGQCNADIKG